MRRYRNKLSPAHRDILALLSGRRPASPAPNWREILRIADENRVKPLIYDSVRSLGLDVPEEYLLPMERSYAATFAKNCEILNALDEMGRILSPYGIEAVPIKGASLIQRVYKDPGLRPLSDLDVWIHGDKAYDAMRILLSKGFAKKWDEANSAPLRYGEYASPPFCRSLKSKIGPLIVNSHFRNQQIQAWNAQLPLKLFLPRGNGIKFELHHCLAWLDYFIGSSQMAREIWNRRRLVAGKKGLALVSEKDELIILATHLLDHIARYNYSLLFHVDIARAWQKKDWRSGIENTDNREVKKLVDLCVASLAPAGEEPAGPSPCASFGVLFFGGIQPGFLEKNQLLLRSLAKIREDYGFFKLARYFLEWAFPSPADMRYICGNRNGSLFFLYFHRIFKMIRKIK